MNALTLVTEQTEHAVTLAELKQQSRIDLTDDDTFISDLLIPAAEEVVESYLNRPMVVRTYKLTMDAWPSGGCIEFPRPPLAGVTSVQYTDIDGNQSTYSSANYIVDTASTPGRLVLKKTASWPSDELQEANAIEITFTAGYATVNNIPVRARQAVLMVAATLYEHRENIVIQPGIALADLPIMQQLLQPLRYWKF